MENEIKMIVKVGIDDYNNDTKCYLVNLMKNLNIQNVVELYNNDIKCTIYDDDDDYFYYYFKCDQEGEYELTLKFTTNLIDCEGLFSECKNLISIDLSSFNPQEIITMKSMFLNCKNLKSINFSDFDSAKLTDMSQIFKGCINLQEINLSFLNSMNIQNMSEMFSQCGIKYLAFPDLLSINLQNIRGMFSNCPNLKSVDFSSFNTEKVTDMSNLFEGCENLENIDFSKLNTKSVNSMEKMFYKANLININLSSLNIKNVKNLSYFFSECKNLNNNHLASMKLNKNQNVTHMFEGCDLNNINLSYIDTSKISNLDYFLAECKNIKINKDSTINLKNCLSMNYMFYKSNLSKVNFTFLDSKNVEHMDYCFAECKNLIINEKSVLNAKNCIDFDYGFYKCDLLNVNFSFIDIRNAENMKYCFAECKNLKINEKSILNAKNCFDLKNGFYKCDLYNVNFSFLDIRNVENMDYCFEESTNLKINEKSILKARNCISMNYGFYKCDLSNVNFSFLDIRNVKNMDYCFAESKNISINSSSILKAKCCINMEYGFYKSNLKNVNFSFLHISNVKNLDYCFAECENIIINENSKLKLKNSNSMKSTFCKTDLINVNFSCLDIRNVENMSCCFSECKNVTLNDNSNFDSKKVRDMSYMFSCWDLKDVNFSFLNTTNVTNINGFFSECKNITNEHLASLDTKNIINMNYMFIGCDLKNLNFSFLNTDKVIDMSSFFCECKNITNEHLASLNTKSVINMDNMLSYCDLTNINISLLNTKNVKNMNGMFSNCQSSTNINFKHFNTNNVRSMKDMFINCKLEHIDISYFNLDNVENISQMFCNCSDLKYLALPPLNRTKKIEMYNIFNNCSSLKIIKMWRTPNENYNKLVLEKRNLDQVQTIFFNENKVQNKINNLNQGNINIGPIAQDFQLINNMYYNNNPINNFQNNDFLNNNNFMNNNLNPFIDMNNINQFSPHNFPMNINNMQNMNNINPLLFNNNINLNNINPNTGF